MTGSKQSRPGLGRRLESSRLRHPDELRPLLGVSMLAQIPKRAFPGRHTPGQNVRESFEALRTSLTYFNLDRTLEVILIASPGRGEGRTTVATNLAAAMARDGREVILLDADLRKPRAADRLGVDPMPGLEQVLVDEVDLDGVLRRVDVDGGSLWVLGSPGPVQNPAILLGSQRMHDLLGELRDRCDLVIVDAPPLLAVSDAIPLLRQISGAILVGEINRTPTAALSKSQEVIEAAGGKLLGAVATGAEAGGPYGYYGEDFDEQQVESIERESGRQRRKRERAERKRQRQERKGLKKAEKRQGIQAKVTPEQNGASLAAAGTAAAAFGDVALKPGEGSGPAEVGEGADRVEDLSTRQFRKRRRAEHRRERQEAKERRKAEKEQKRRAKAEELSNHKRERQEAKERHKAEKEQKRRAKAEEHRRRKEEKAAKKAKQVWPWPAEKPEEIGPAVAPGSEVETTEHEVDAEAQEQATRRRERYKELERRWAEKKQKERAKAKEPEKIAPAVAPGSEVETTEHEVEAEAQEHDVWDELRAAELDADAAAAGSSGAEARRKRTENTRGDVRAGSEGRLHERPGPAAGPRKATGKLHPKMKPTVAAKKPVDQPRGLAKSRSTPYDDSIERIRRLGELRKDGFITDEEFRTKKAELLQRL